MKRLHAVAVCGMGAETPYGHGVSCYWQGILEKRDAISAMDLFDLQGLACTHAGVIRTPPRLPPTLTAPQPRSICFAAAAGWEALCQAGIESSPECLSETALVIASNFGMLDSGERALMPPGSPEESSAAARDIPPGHAAETLADALRLGGMRLSLSLSCASGAAAVAKAADLIAFGIVRRALVIGFDAHSRFSWSGLCALRTMTKERIRPFDLHRSGTIFSEGAAAVLLASDTDSRTRGLTPLAWISGWATGNNGHHLTAPAPRGAGSGQVMRDAIRAAGLPLEAIDHINAHGTGTRANDSTEAQAIADLFGARFDQIPVTSVKGAAGHLLGAAGTAELIASVLTLRQGIVPPIANLEQPDPDCPLRLVREPLTGDYRAVLTNSAGFGGCNAALVVTAAPHPAGEPEPCPVIISGAGILSALGIGREEVSAAWAEGESACFPLARLPWAGEPPETGEVPDFDLAEFGVTPKPYLDAASRYLLAACGEALASGALNREQTARCRAGISIGSAWGCTETAQRFFADYVRKGPRLVKPMLFPHTYANTAISLAAMEWSLRGNHANLTSSHTASAWALVDALLSLRKGETDLMLAAGCEALSYPRLTQTGDRVPGEGAAALLLEREGARPLRRLAAIAGIGISAAPEQALAHALHEAGLREEQLSECFVEGNTELEILARTPKIRASALFGDTEGAAFAHALVLALDHLDKGPLAVAVADGSVTIICLLTA